MYTVSQVNKQNKQTKTQQSLPKTRQNKTDRQEA